MDSNQYQQPQYPPPPGYAPPSGYEQPPAYDQQAAAYGYQQPGAYPGYPAVAQRTSGMAIASLILSILGIGLLGVIFGHLALSEIKKSNGMVGGQGLAMAGLIIGYVEIGLSLLVCAILTIAFIGAGLSSQPSGLIPFLG